jgi:hypothetical protein
VIQGVVAALAAGVLVGGVATWSYQGHRYERQIAETKLQGQMLLRRKEAEYVERIHAAEEAAARNAARAKADAGRARNALERVRNTADTAARVASDTPTTCPDTATAFRDVFGACAAAITELAGQADGHTVDIRKLIQAWPSTQGDKK